MLPAKIEIEGERARRSLSLFVKLAWHVLEPGPLQWGWHLDLLCQRLEAVAHGEVRRLLVNLPPRHGKSLICSVFFPAWVWASDPTKRFLCASYAQDLAVRDSVLTRQLVTSPWYRGRYGHVFELSGDQNEKDRFSNTRGGRRLATSPGGFATGEGGDIVLVDDPHRIEEASSDAARERVVDWLTRTMSTRANDPRSGTHVAVGQRVHERDVFGHLLERGGSEHLCLAAEFEPDHPARCADDPRTEPGQLLWPERFGRAEIDGLKRDLGSYAYAAQFQQRPAPAGGGIFERGWWRWYHPEGYLPDFTELIQSWDASFGDAPGADYVVGQLWGRAGADRYLIVELRDRMSFTEAVAAVRELNDYAARRFRHCARRPILVEAAANGPAIIDHLRREIGGVIAVSPRGTKLSRAQAVQPLVEAGNVYLPGAPSADGESYDRAQTPEWVQGFVEECASFPRGAHDDRVDAMTQALTKVAKKVPRVRRLV